MQIDTFKEFLIWLNGFEYSFHEDTIGISPSSTQYRMIRNKLDRLREIYNAESPAHYHSESISVTHTAVSMPTMPPFIARKPKT